MCAVSEIGSDPKMTNREKAVTVALDNAISRLKHVDMPERCNILELNTRIMKSISSYLVVSAA